MPAYLPREYLLVQGRSHAEAEEAPPLILGQESKNSRMQENTVAVMILRIGQQISPPPFLVSDYGPASGELTHWRRKRGGGQGGHVPPTFQSGGQIYVCAPHFQTQNLGICPPHILSRSYAVVTDSE